MLREIIGMFKIENFGFFEAVLCLMFSPLGMSFTLVLWGRTQSLDSRKTKKIQFSVKNVLGKLVFEYHPYGWV